MKHLHTALLVACLALLAYLTFQPATRPGPPAPDHGESLARLERKLDELARQGEESRKVAAATPGPPTSRDLEKSLQGLEAGLRGLRERVEAMRAELAQSGRTPADDPKRAERLEASLKSLTEELRHLNERFARVVNFAIGRDGP
jgi:hypothetical protein